LDDDHLIEAQELLEDWNYQAHMDSSAAALFEVYWVNLLALTFHDDLPEDFYPGGGSRWYEVVRMLIAQPNNAWWDDSGTSEVESMDEILMRAFEAAVKDLDRELGKNPADWRWGELHTLPFHHGVMSSLPIVNNIFAQGPFYTSGGISIVNATGWIASNSYEVISLPSMRMIVDMSDLSNSVTMHTTGQSGHVEHPHYIDMADNWRNIEYHPMLWLRSDIEANAESHLILTP
jgi:penicillin amidase